MECPNCKSKLRDSDKYCSECGVKVNKELIAPTDASTENIRSASVLLGIMSIVGVCLFIFGPISLILSIIGLIFALKSNKHVKNTPGIILNGIALLLSFVVTAIIAFFIAICIDMIDDFEFDEYYHGDPIIERRGEHF